MDVISVYIKIAEIVFLILASINIHSRFCHIQSEPRSIPSHKIQLQLTFLHTFFIFTHQECFMSEYSAFLYLLPKGKFSLGLGVDPIVVVAWVPGRLGWARASESSGPNRLTTSRSHQHSPLQKHRRTKSIYYARFIQSLIHLYEHSPFVLR